jgi:hypothetical protein
VEWTAVYQMGQLGHFEVVVSLFTASKALLGWPWEQHIGEISPSMALSLLEPRDMLRLESSTQYEHPQPVTTSNF